MNLSLLIRARALKFNPRHSKRTNQPSALMVFETNVNIFMHASNVVVGVQVVLEGRGCGFDNYNYGIYGTWWSYVY